MKKFQNFILLFIVLVGMLPVTNTLAQEANEETANPEEIFSAFLFPGRLQRGGFDYTTLEPLQAGLVGLFDLTTKYGNIFLGGDFQEVSKTQFSCDPIVQKMTKVENSPLAQTDGKFFTPGKVNQISDLEGYYYFKNNNFLPGILANAEIWMKMEAYQTAKTTEKNCLVIKILVPEKVNGVVKNSVYMLKSDGKIKAVPNAQEVDISKSKEFPNYWIVPLKDPNGNSHISGQGFSVLGTFVTQSNCKNLSGLLFPVVTKGEQVKSIFLRKVTGQVPINF